MRMALAKIILIQILSESVCVCVCMSERGKERVCAQIHVHQGQATTC